MGGRIEVRVERDATHAIATVVDNGIGIERDFIPRVFDPLSQEDLSATRLYKGLGLGLAIARHSLNCTAARSARRVRESSKARVSLCACRSPPSRPQQKSEAATGSAFRRKEPLNDLKNTDRR